MSMIRVVCNSRRVSDIQTRQPKSPGQGLSQQTNFTVPPQVSTSGKTVQYSKNFDFASSEPTEAWANSLKKKDKQEAEYRCTKCGAVGHKAVARV